MGRWPRRSRRSARGRHFECCTKASRSSSRIPGTPARRRCWRRSGSRRWRRLARASPSRWDDRTASVDPRRGRRAHARARRGDEPPGFGRPRERLRRRARGGRAGDLARRAGGAVGGSIEDYDPDGGIYGLEHAIERVAAAVEAAGGLDFPFTLDGARREPHSRRPRPRRHDRPPAGLRAGRRGRSLRAGAARRRRDPRRPRGDLQAPQRPRPARTLDGRDRRGRRAARSASAAASPGSRSTRWQPPPSSCATGATCPRSPTRLRSSSGFRPECLKTPAVAGEHATPPSRPAPQSLNPLSRFDFGQSASLRHGQGMAGKVRLRPVHESSSVV